MLGSFLRSRRLDASPLQFRQDGRRQIGPARTSLQVREMPSHSFIERRPGGHPIRLVPLGVDRAHHRLPLFSTCSPVWRQVGPTPRSAERAALSIKVAAKPALPKCHCTRLIIASVPACCGDQPAPRARTGILASATRCSTASPPVRFRARPARRCSVRPISRGQRPAIRRPDR